MNGGIYTFLFWFGAVFLGGVLSMLLFWVPRTRQSRGAVGAVGPGRPALAGHVRKVLAGRGDRDRQRG